MARPKGITTSGDSTKVARLRRALIERLKVHEQDGTLPTSSRFLYYELEGKSDEYGILVSKVKTGARRSDQDLIDALTSLREDGTIPWDSIIDETRHVDGVTHAASVRQSLERSLKYTSIDPWASSDVRPFIICESRSLSGVLSTVGAQYGVQRASSNGQAAGFLRTKLASTLNGLPPEQTVSILYCGDKDAAGEDIEYNTRSVLAECVPSGFEWKRLMLTSEQVTKYKLPSIIKKDGRRKDGATHEAWECEALSQKLIVDLVEERLAAMLLPRTLEDVAAQEDEERQAITII